MGNVSGVQRAVAGLRVQRLKERVFYRGPERKNGSPRLLEPGV